MNTIAKQVIDGFEVRLVEHQRFSLPDFPAISSYYVLLHYLLVPNEITAIKPINATSEWRALKEFERQIRDDEIKLFRVFQ